MRFGLEQHAPLLGRNALPIVRLDLLGRQLPLPQLLEQRFDLVVAFARIGLADQHVDALDIELAESRPQLLAGFLLNRLPLVQQFEHRLGMGDVAEERAQHRVERLRDQLLHVAEALDHARRTLVVDMHDDRQRQQRLVRVLRHQVDRLQTLIVAMRLGLAGDPVQHEVRRRHQHDAAGRRVERVFARPKRPLANTALAVADSLAVAEAGARDVLALPAVVAHHDADVADRHHRLRNQLDRREPAVDEVSAVGERHILPTAAAAGGEKRLGILVVVVVVRIIGIRARRPGR